MRIAVTVDPEIPVPPAHYGGIERIVYLLVKELSGRGHDVTLFAHPDSRVPCRLVAFPGDRSASLLHAVRNSTCIVEEALRERFDIIHSFGRLGYLVPLLPAPVPKIMSYQRHVSARSVIWGNRLSRGSLHFTACSEHLAAGLLGLGDWHVIYNAVSPESYTFQREVAADAPLVFLGRVEPIKGPHIAVQVARATGKRLVIAGNVPREHRGFAEEQVFSHVDGEQIRYAGVVDDAQKNVLLGSASALLMPVLWDEPFGIVMAEALACGTPVIGFDRGSVPEVIEDGRTGIICSDVGAMIAAVGAIGKLDRACCRQSAEARFSADAMVGGYLDLYARCLS
jgi:glycosyltransferase involved in cell wall biosynthesis